METNKKYKYKNGVGAYCLQIKIEGEPNLVMSVIDAIDNHILEDIKKVFECIEEI